MGALPPKELGGWKSCKGEEAPTEDTHEAVVFASFFIRGLRLPIFSFVRGLLNFYSIDLTHLNPKSILQIAIFIHLCEAFLGIISHFGLWKYLYHCEPDMRDEVLQVIGDASFKPRHGRKSMYLDIPLNDSNRGWHADCFTIENHGKSLLARSGRLPNTKHSNDILLKEIADLKEKGLTAQAVVIDFAFRGIQPLKDRAFPAYLDVGANHPTREVSRRIIEQEIKALESVNQVLKWTSNLTPQEMEAIVAATQGIGNNEASTFIMIQCPALDSEGAAKVDTHEGGAPEHEGADSSNKAPEHSNIAGESTLTRSVPKRARTKVAAVKPELPQKNRTAEQQVHYERRSNKQQDIETSSPQAQKLKIVEKELDSLLLDADLDECIKEIPRWPFNSVTGDESKAPSCDDTTQHLRNTHQHICSKHC
ncbi:hypothetical protein BS78_08G059500 [Paspalum vaginatum]|nr:hypothetical protein BS78_08G059500 [Paspalum vaginatum]